MAGTKEDGLKAAAKNKARYGEDFYSRIGRIGGSVTGVGGGFASEIPSKDGLTGFQRAKIYGKKGGFASRKDGSVHILSDEQRAEVARVEAEIRAELALKNQVK